MIQEFFKSGRLPKGLNHTFIVLIPKIPQAKNPGDFRPISLFHVIYKAITKIIANRLRSLLDRFVSPNQSAFVPRRQILDNSIIAQEIIHSMKNQRGAKGLLTLKMDMSKAYDRVEWTFVRDVLHKFGFSSAFSRLIWECMTTSSFSILINGNPQGFIQPERGLRQGCPLSPYLFILCSEVLERKMQFGLTYSATCQTYWVIWDRSLPRSRYPLFRPRKIY